MSVILVPFYLLLALSVEILTAADSTLFCRNLFAGYEVTACGQAKR
jgi:hypothetical protein